MKTFFYKDKNNYPCSGQTPQTSSDFIEISEKEYNKLIEKQKKADLKKLTYEQKRLAEYGDVAKQIEFITENGLVAWKKKVEAIKTKHPKN